MSVQRKVSSSRASDYSKRPEIRSQFLNEAAYLISGKFTRSIEEILKPFTFKLLRKSTINYTDMQSLRLQYDSKRINSITNAPALQ